MKSKIYVRAPVSRDFEVWEQNGELLCMITQHRETEFYRLDATTYLLNKIGDRKIEFSESTHSCRRLFARLSEAIALIEELLEESAND